MSLKPEGHLKLHPQYLAEPRNFLWKSFNLCNFFCICFFWSWIIRKGLTSSFKKKLEGSWPCKHCTYTQHQHVSAASNQWNYYHALNYRLERDICNVRASKNVLLYTGSIFSSSNCERQCLGTVSKVHYVIFFFSKQQHQKSVNTVTRELM